MHESADPCPGDLLATGPERHGWRVLAETPKGPEVHGTLVAQVGDIWRARILTYPNVLWVIPSGSTMKFVGATPASAEQEAIAFIKEHCRRRGYTIRKEVPYVESGKVELEQEEQAALSDVIRASQRKVCNVRVNYGVGLMTESATTDDLSETGLFVRTDKPLLVGTVIRLALDLHDDDSISLRGIVRWARDEDEIGRPRGMGIKLIHPDSRYVNYVRQRNSAGLEDWDDPGI
jgi:Tfp pilus assembly protein PilZ